MLDVLLEQRSQNRDGGDEAVNTALIPSELKRRFEVRLTLMHEDKNNYMALRTVRSNHIGQVFISIHIGQVSIHLYTYTITHT